MEYAQKQRKTRMRLLLEGNHNVLNQGGHGDMREDSKENLEDLLCYTLLENTFDYS